MQKYFILLLFSVLFIAQSFGVELSLAPGLSVKNLFLYAILALMVLTEVRKKSMQDINFSSAASSRNRSANSGIQYIHILYCLLIFYVLISMLTVLAVFVNPDYDWLEGVIAFKGDIIDRYLFLLVFFYGLKDADECIWLLKWMLGLIIFGNVITLMDALDMPDLGMIHQRADGRVSGPMGESNQYASFLILFLPVTVYMCFITKGMTRVMMSVGAIVSLGALLLAASRGGMVGLALAGVAVTVYVWKHINKQYFFSAGLAVGILASLMIVFVAIQSEGLLTERFIDQSGGYGSNAKSISSGRTEIWSKAIYKMNEAPVSYVLGYGWSTWESADDMARLFENVTRYNMAPHNSYLALLFEIGIIGLGLFLAIVAGIFKYLKSSLELGSSNSNGIIIAFMYGFVALLVSIIFVDLYNPWLYAWSLIGIVLRLAYDSLDDSEHTEKKIEDDAEQTDESLVGTSAGTSAETASPAPGASPLSPLQSIVP